MAVPGHHMNGVAKYSRGARCSSMYTTVSVELHTLIQAQHGVGEKERQIEQLHLVIDISLLPTVPCKASMMVLLLVMAV